MKKRLIQIALILGLMTLTCVAAQASETGAPTSGFRVVEVESAYESDVALTPVDDKGADVTKLFAIPVRETIGRAKSVPADQYKDAYAQMRADMAQQIEEIAAQGGENA